VSQAQSLPTAQPYAPHEGVKRYADYRGELRDSCDVVVVGSGPGGAVAAKELAEAGLDVVLLEEGPPIGPADMRTEAGEALRRLFRESGLRVARGNGFFPTMQAIALGGGSVVNSAICCRAPGWALDEWAEQHALPELGAGGLDADFAEVERFLGVAPTPDDVLGERNLLFKRGCDALEISCEPTPRNVRACRGSGECFSGCRNGAKQSTDISYVPAAIRAGARVYTSVRVEQLIVDGKRVVGVRGKTIEPFTNKEGALAEIRAKTVVLAAGCMASPLIMMRSRVGTDGGHLGEHLKGHPGLAAYGLYDHKVEPWKGATQGYQSLEYLKEGMKLEVLWAPPALLAVRFPGFGDEFKGHLLAFERMAPFDVFVSAKHSEGSVKPMGKHDADIRFHLDQRDVSLLQRGLAILTDISFAAGAVEVQPGVRGAPPVLSRAQGSKPLREASLKATDFTVGMNHVFGSARMGGNPRTSVCDGFGKVHGVEGLYIADTSVFPASPAVNPMLTCMALARRTARSIAAGRA
jgi:choline dehydrogenase-like flavoprotein